jgi:hypothetical protein
MPEKKSERKHFLQLTFRHTGAAAKSGLPAANNNCAWCACTSRAVSPSGHHRNLPFDSLLVANQKPMPS